MKLELYKVQASKKSAYLAMPTVKESIEVFILLQLTNDSKEWTLVCTAMSEGKILDQMKNRIYSENQ